MASFLLPPQPHFALPGSPDAERLGCTCPGSCGRMLGLRVPIGKVGERPRFGAPKEFWYWYSTDCVLHGGTIDYALEQLDKTTEQA